MLLDLEVAGQRATTAPHHLLHAACMYEVGRKTYDTYIHPDTASSEHLNLGK